MNKRSLVTVGVLLGGAFGISCVSPFYGTARIEPGWHMDAGVAATSYIGASEWYPYCIGLRSDGEVRYGFNRYLGISARAALGLGYILPEQTPSGSLMPILDGAIGLQGSVPFEIFTPALRIELSYYFDEPALSTAFLMGFGQKENVTFGGRVHIEEWNEIIGFDLFTGVHPTSYWTIFGGIEVTTLFDHPITPLLTLGIGYNFK